MIYGKLIIWLLVIAAFVVADWYQIVKQGKRPFYLLENILKGIAFILYGVIIWNTQYERFTLVLFLWCVSSWWIIFDIVIGIVLHEDPLYVGRNSGWLDRFHYLNDWTKVAYWMLKFIVLLSLCGTTISILNHG